MSCFNVGHVLENDKNINLFKSLNPGSFESPPILLQTQDFVKGHFNCPTPKVGKCPKIVRLEGV